MIVSKHTNCATCKKRITVKREFIETIDMFNQTTKPILRGELLEQIKAFRSEPAYCEDHIHD